MIDPHIIRITLERYFTNIFHAIMRHERQVLIYLGILAFVAVLILPYYIFSKDPFSPAKTLWRIIDYYDKLEALENELSSMLKRHPYENLIEKEIEPIEDLITKEMLEVQMYLKEFSPSDILVLKDFEEAVDEIEKKLKAIPQRVQPTIQMKAKKKSEIVNSKMQLTQDYPSFKSEMSNLESIGIYLNVKDSAGRNTPKGFVTGGYKLSAIETLRKLHVYFVTLEKLHDKVTSMGRHSSVISEETEDERDIDSLMTQMNKTEVQLLETIYTGQSGLRNVHPYTEALFNRIQDYFYVMQKKDYFWNNEWEERLRGMQKQYENLRKSVVELQDSYRLRTKHKEL